MFENSRLEIAVELRNWISRQKIEVRLRKKDANLVITLLRDINVACSKVPEKLLLYFPKYDVWNLYFTEEIILAGGIISHVE